MSATQRISFTVPLPPPALRLNHRAQHWAARSKAADEYSAQITDHWLTQTGGLYAAKRWPRASATFIWRYAGKRPDVDNCAASLKVLQDTLACAPPNGSPTRTRWFLGIVADDGDLDPVTFRREKTATRAAECVEVTIERIEGVR